MASINDLVANFTGLSGQLADLRSKVDSLSTAAAERDALQAKVISLTNELSTVTASLATSESLVVTLKASVEAAEKKAKDAEASVDSLASQKALAIVAAQGAPAIDAGAPTDNPGKTKADSAFANLTGLDKAIAAHKASYK